MTDDLIAIHVARKRRRARIRREIELASQFVAVAESYNLLDLIDKVLKGEWSAIRRST
jgi:hypothetical protein